MTVALGYLIEAALMLLLGVAIYFGWRLNRQIAVIRNGREELQKLISEFSNATGRAELALAELKGEVTTTLAQSRDAAKKAVDLCDDLEFLVKRGEKVADALEVGIRGASAEGRKGTGSREAAARSTAVLPSETEASPNPSRSLSVGPEDRPVDVPPKRGGSAAKKARAKSKSDLLKALQDMR